MKKHFYIFILKVFLLFSFPPIFTLLVTGIHKKAVPVQANPSYIHLSDSSADEVVNKEEYILGVTAGFMADWDFNTPGSSEIAKMYAVLINTYMALKSNGTLLPESEDFDLKYLNADMRRLLWKDADSSRNETLLSGWLSEVSGLVIKHDGELITPYFHQLSAGATRTGPFPYLANANTNLDLEHPSFLSVTEYTNADFFHQLAEKYPDLEMSNADVKDYLQIISRDRSGYVTKIQAGNLCISGEEFADLFGLPSSAFTITFPENSIKFITKGIGHGYGVSLNYAAYLASKQQTYDIIFSYFYNNIEITNE